MNELERQLTQALSALSGQYKTDMTRLEDQNKYLHQQVNSLTQRVEALAGQLNHLEPYLKNLTEAVSGLSLKR